MDYGQIFLRRHDLVRCKSTTWKRASDAYSGGVDYIGKALIKHIAETPEEFAERLSRAYYVNHPRHVAQLISRYVFSVEPSRSGADAALIADFSRTGLRADEVMLQLCTILNCFGIGWLLVDYPSVSAPVDMEAKQRRKLRPFARVLSPFEVIDWCDGADGSLEWALVEECHEDKRDPFALPHRCRRLRLWMRSEWMLFESDALENSQLIGRSSHNLGCVPLVKVVEPGGFGMGANHWFEDVVRISDAILNAESEAQMNIVKQMFGLLVVARDFAANSKSEDAAKISRASSVWENVEERGITRYIAPSGAETAAIRSEIKELKLELYNAVGLALQSSSKQAQTAESKAWDSHNVEQFLSGRSVILEQAEKRAWELFALWEPAITVPDVAYNREFSIIDLSTSVAALMDLSSFEAGTQYRRATASTALALLDKVFRIPPDKYQQIEKEIDALEENPAPVPEMNRDLRVDDFS